MSVLLGNGNGTFAAKVDYITGTGPQGIAVGDFDGNQKPDLVVTNPNGGTLSVLLGNGNGTFAAKVDYPTGNNTPFGGAVGDFNGDRAPDVAYVNSVSTVSILLNQCK